MTGQPLQLEVVYGFEMFSFDPASMDRLLDARGGSWAGWWDDSMSGQLGSSQTARPRYSTVPAADEPSLMVIRDEIRPHVERVVGSYGEFLPVRSDAGLLWAFHCTNVVDALDLDRCEGVAWADVPEGDPPRILTYYHLRFIPEKVREGKVFVVPQRRRGLIYFAPEVAEALMDPPELFTGSTFRLPYGSNG